MADPKRILLALDHVPTSNRAVSYVANILGHRADVVVRLLYVSPHLPPVLLEWGGSGDPARERVWLDTERKRYEEEREREAQDIFDGAKSILTEAGVPPAAVESQSYPSVATQDVVNGILDVAHKDGFGTIVIGRQCLSRLRELFHHHFSDELIKKGCGTTVWIVE